MRSFLFIFASIFLVNSPLYGQDTWRWDDRNASIATSFSRSPERYEVRLVRKNRKGSGFLVQVYGAEVLLHQWESNVNEAFTFSGTTLLYTEHLTGVPGCKLVAYDLAGKKQLWKTSLIGLGDRGPRFWSSYRNRINLLVANEEAIVYGLSLIHI